MPELLPALSQRRAKRAFDARPVPPDAEQLLWQAVSVAPSQGNCQPTRVLVAESPAARESLIAALSDGNRHWARAAPLLCALVANPEHDSVRTSSDGTERELWAFHVGIAIGNLMAQATALGIVAHPMAGFDEPAVRTAFQAPPQIRVVAVVAIGYPGSPETLPVDLRERESAPQVRLPLSTLVGRDMWTPALDISARGLRKPRS
jgi:nitroreductase